LASLKDLQNQDEHNIAVQKVPHHLCIFSSILFSCLIKRSQVEFLVNKTFCYFTSKPPLGLEFLILSSNGNGFPRIIYIITCFETRFLSEKYYSFLIEIVI